MRKECKARFIDGYSTVSRLLLLRDGYYHERSTVSNRLPLSTDIHYQQPSTTISRHPPPSTAIMSPLRPGSRSSSSLGIPNLDQQVLDWFAGTLHAADAGDDDDSEDDWQGGTAERSSSSLANDVETLYIIKSVYGSDGKVVEGEDDSEDEWDSWLFDALSVVEDSESED
jgi:hypothetical protein